MELILGVVIGAVAAIVVLTADWAVQAVASMRRAGPANLARDPRPTVAVTVQTPARDSASSTDWIRNTIGAPDGGVVKRRGRSRARARCPVCRAWIVKGAEVCENCGALVST